MGRKTVSVNAMRDYINDRIATKSKNISERIGLIVVLEEILHTTGNYSGFRYLEDREIVNVTGDPKESLPGVRHHAGQRMVDGVDTWFVDTDRTRVSYF